MASFRAYLFALGMIASVTACGSEADSSAFTESNPTGPIGGPGAGAIGSSEPVTPSSACATSSANGEVVPVYLVFMYDRSGSMKNNSKWSSAKSGMESFFADPTTKGLFASLSFFAQPDPDTCAPESYVTPAVAMLPLPDATAFSAAIGAVTPGGVGGGTPTLPAAKGAVKLAQNVLAAHAPDGKVAIVLVTDGEPDGCNSTPANVAEELAKVKATIPTYVIGVGSETTNLDTIATGGGTAPATIIQTSNPAQTAQDFTKALQQIKQQALSCEYVLPQPPNGAALDVNAVNVTFTPAQAPTQTLVYSHDCANSSGWHYDDVKAPTKIIICPTSCGSFQSSSGKVDIVFGCQTSGDVR
jgi:hypothetical protein